MLDWQRLVVRDHLVGDWDARAYREVFNALWNRINELEKEITELKELQVTVCVEGNGG